MKNLYHYTNEYKARAIIDSGHLIPTGQPATPREKPVLWFSTHPFYEPTAIKPLVMGGELVEVSLEVYREMFTLYRFWLVPGYPVSSWDRTCKLAKTPSKLRKAMEIKGRRQGGNPKQWFGTLEPVTLDNVVEEILVGDVWEPWNREKHGMPETQPENIRSMQYDKAKREFT